MDCRSLLILLACQAVAALVVTPRPALVSRTRGVTMETKGEKLKAEGLERSSAFGGVGLVHKQVWFILLNGCNDLPKAIT